VSQHDEGSTRNGDEIKSFDLAFILKICQYQYTIPSLIALLEKPMNQTELSKRLEVKNRTSIRRSAEILKEVGLVNFRREVPRTLNYSLTDKGRACALLLNRMCEICKGDPQEEGTIP
jgi:DNA-binding HxlR family transcriptional regulator